VAVLCFQIAFPQGLIGVASAREALPGETSSQAPYVIGPSFPADVAWAQSTYERLINKNPTRLLVLRGLYQDLKQRQLKAHARSDHQFGYRRADDFETFKTYVVQLDRYEEKLGRNDFYASAPESGVPIGGAMKSRLLGYFGLDKGSLHSRSVSGAIGAAGIFTGVGSTFNLVPKSLAAGMTPQVVAAGGLAGATLVAFDFLSTLQDHRDTQDLRLLRDAFPDYAALLASHKSAPTEARLSSLVMLVDGSPDDTPHTVGNRHRDRREGRRRRGQFRQRVL
jgi:hypothetical protein